MSASTHTKWVQGVPVPAIGLGTWPLTDEECSAVTCDAIEVGYRHLDTAQMYKNEAAVGEGIRRGGLDRDELFVTTKIDNDQHAPADVRTSVAQSIEDLGGYVDLLLVHWPVEWAQMSDTLTAMAEFVDKGTVGRLGVSNFSPEQLQEAMNWAPLFCIQVEHHPFKQQEELRAMARTHDLLFTAYSPLARGRVFASETLRPIAEAHGVSAGSLVLRWLLEIQNVVPIPRTSTRAHLEANLASLDLMLTADELAKIGMAEDPEPA